MNDKKLLCAECGHAKVTHFDVRDDSSGEVLDTSCQFPNCDCEEFTLDDRKEA